MRRRAAVIEAFPPKFMYGTGIELSNLAGLLHLPLLLQAHAPVHRHTHQLDTLSTPDSLFFFCASLAAAVAAR